MDVEKPPIDRILEHYGAPFVPSGNGWRKMRCPFQEKDNNPSASVNVTTGRFKCFSCGLNEDAYGIVIWKGDASDFPSAKQFIEDLLGRSYGDVSRQPAGKPRRRGVFEESRTAVGQRSIFQTRVRREPLAGA
ncbi:CHC2 zinc finger domain-containing protein [Micromonospora avicenniae]|uniref:CHC2 zinc finger domain-containing protein n=1 Tax=Micromonospora avicenniae TaxID=1198245 RepID=UPI0033211173